MFLNNPSLLETVKTNNKIKALIFDMDGTLVNTLPPHYAAWLKACSEYGIEFPMEYFKQLTGRPAIEFSKDLVKEFNIPADPHELEQKKEMIVQTMVHKVKVFPAAMDILNYFHNKLPMAVGTGARKEMAEKILSQTNIRHFFEHIVSSDDVSHYKPHPETFLKAAQHFNIDPANCLVFEDGKLGIEAAKTAGMKVIDVNNYY